MHDPFFMPTNAGAPSSIWPSTEVRGGVVVEINASEMDLHGDGLSLDSSYSR
jgi:hypothetical protein